MDRMRSGAALSLKAEMRVVTPGVKLSVAVIRNMLLVQANQLAAMHAEHRSPSRHDSLETKVNQQARVHGCTAPSRVGDPCVRRIAAALA